MIAIYSRKSKYTAKGESVANQIEICKQYIQIHFSNEEFVVYEDEGFSGKNTDRPQFKKMMSQIEQNGIKKIVCYRLDRISRNMSDFVRLIDILNDIGVQFVSVSEQFDTSLPIGKAMMYISSIFAQLERETIAERIRDNLIELAKKGQWLGGVTPTGYKSIEFEFVGINGRCTKAHRLEIDSNEENIIKTIYNKYLELQSISKLRNYLVKNGIKTKNNIPFTFSTIRAILKNPIYAVADCDSYEYFSNYDIYALKSEFNGKYGVIAYNKTTQRKNCNTINTMKDWIISVGRHKGIISGADWVKAQSLIQTDKNRLYKFAGKNNALLHNIIYCSCGSIMQIKQGRNGTYYYVCKLKKNSNLQKCQAKNINGAKIDDYIINIIKNIKSDNINLIKKLVKYKKYLKLNVEDNIDVLSKISSKYNMEINNLVSKLANADAQIGKYIINRINELDIENAKIERKILECKNRKINDNSVITSFENIRDEVDSFSNCIDNMDIKQKQNMIDSIIDKIIWDNKNIKIKFKTNKIMKFEWNNEPKIVENNTWEKLRYWRCKRKYLQKDIANCIGVSRAKYMKYEKTNGFCPADNLKKIAKLLNIDFAELAEEYHYFQLSDNQEKKIELARKKLGLSKTEFANLIGVDRSCIYKWESGKGKLSRKNFYKIQSIVKNKGLTFL